MAEPSTTPPETPPSPGRVIDLRRIPPGVVPRHLQQWVLMGTAVVMVGILAVFVVVTLPSIDLDMLAFSEYPSVADIVASVALTFFAFLGFSVITFAAGDMRNPASDLPKAMNRALGWRAAR